MNLEIQIQVLVYSLIYGMFFSFVMNLGYRYIFYTKTYYKVTINFLFIFNMVLIYFIILRKINNGIFHSYFLLMIILGILIGNNKTKVLRKVLKGKKKEDKKDK